MGTVTTATKLWSAALAINPVAIVAAALAEFAILEVKSNAMNKASDEAIAKALKVKDDANEIVALKAQILDAEKNGATVIAHMDQNGKMFSVTIDQAKEKLKELQKELGLATEPAKTKKKTGLGLTDLNAEEEQKAQMERLAKQQIKFSKEYQEALKKALKKEQEDQINGFEDQINGYWDLQDEEAEAITDGNKRKEALIKAHYGRLKALATLRNKDTETLQLKENNEEKKLLDEKNRAIIAQAQELGDAYGNAIGGALGKGKEGLKDAMQGVLDASIDFIEKLALSAVASNALKDIALHGPIYGAVEAAIESVAITAVATGAKSAIGHMAYGGVVTGGIPGQDSVNAKLMPGEIIYNPAHPNPALASMINSGNNSTQNTTHVHFASPNIHIHGNPDQKSLAKMTQAMSEAFTQQTHKALQVLVSRGKMPDVKVYK